MRIAIGALGIAVLAALCALALPRGLADLRGFEARVLSKAWDLRRRPPTDEDLDSAFGLLRQAHALDAGQPSYLEDLARLHERRALQRTAGDPVALEELRNALDLQRKAVRLRPSTPYTWASIALLKARLQESDGEFEAALRNAALLGPWEPGVQLALADAGYRHWGRISPETRKALNGNAERALRHQDAKLFELARRHGRLAAWCALKGVERSRLSGACI